GLGASGVSGLELPASGIVQAFVPGAAGQGAIHGLAAALGQVAFHQRRRAEERLGHALLARFEDDVERIRSERAQADCVRVERLQTRDLRSELRIAVLEGHRILAGDHLDAVGGENRGHYPHAERARDCVLGVADDGDALEVVALLGCLDHRGRFDVHAEGIAEGIGPVGLGHAGLGGGHRHLHDLQPVAEWEGRFRRTAVMRADDGEHLVVTDNLAHCGNRFLRIAAFVGEVQFDRHAANAAPGVNDVRGCLGADRLALAGIGSLPGYRSHHANADFAAGDLLRRRGPGKRQGERAEQQGNSPAVAVHFASLQIGLKNRACLMNLPALPEISVPLSRPLQTDVAHVLDAICGHDREEVCVALLLDPELVFPVLLQALYPEITELIRKNADGSVLEEINRRDRRARNYLVADRVNYATRDPRLWQALPKDPRRRLVLGTIDFRRLALFGLAKDTVY